MYYIFHLSTIKTIIVFKNTETLIVFHFQKTVYHTFLFSPFFFNYLLFFQLFSYY